jgi:hypothetical protein
MPSHCPGEICHIGDGPIREKVMTGSISVQAKGVRVAYWVSTVLVTAELGAGGIWDVLRTTQVRETVGHLGYPSYFLVILGVWKLLGMAALLAPRFPLLKEWAYAGVVFADTGAITSHLVVGYGSGELAVLIPLLGLTVLSWSSRPPRRRLSRSPDFQSWSRASAKSTPFNRASTMAWKWGHDS